MIYSKKITLSITCINKSDFAEMPVVDNHTLSLLPNDIRILREWVLRRANHQQYQSWDEFYFMNAVERLTEHAPGGGWLATRISDMWFFCS